MDNKDRFIAFAKAAFMIIWGIIAAMTSAAVWRAAVDVKPESFICWVAGVSLVFTGIGIFLASKAFKNWNK